MTYVDNRFICRPMSSMARLCSTRRRNDHASRRQEISSHAQASTAKSALAQAANAVASGFKNMRAATTEVASAAAKSGVFFMKAARPNRLFRACRNTALCAIALSLLNGTLITPAIPAIDLFALVITLACLVVVRVELTRNRV